MRMIRKISAPIAVRDSATDQPKKPYFRMNDYSCQSNEWRNVIYSCERHADLERSLSFSGRYYVRDASICGL